MTAIWVVGIGGALGAVARFSLAGWLPLAAGSFPWVTLGINLSGSFTLGLVTHLFRQSGLSPTLLLFLTTGFLGAFTTFSTFSLEALELIRTGSAPLALLYLVASIAGGLAAVALGYFLPSLAS